MHKKTLIIKHEIRTPEYHPKIRTLLKSKKNIINMNMKIHNAILLKQQL